MATRSITLEDALLTVDAQPVVARVEEGVAFLPRHAIDYLAERDPERQTGDALLLRPASVSWYVSLERQPALAFHQIIGAISYRGGQLPLLYEPHGAR